MTFAELEELELILASHSQLFSRTVLAELPIQTFRGPSTLPLICVSVKNSLPPDAPTLVITGGVHGLERIGTQVVLAYLKSFSNYLLWDPVSQALAEQIRIFFLPIVNPTGMYLDRRSNSRGVDLMRNAPIDIEKGEIVNPFRIYQGHRISPKLPWYRGTGEGAMEAELVAVEDFFKKEVFPSRAIISCDVHSGFGSVDRLWFPYAKSTRPFPRIAEAMQIKDFLDQSLPNHVYAIEPQSQQYLTHGDFWEYLWEKCGSVYLPLTLEMGSWNWIKKNPLHMLYRIGLFHPIKPHRVRRILRRHWPLLDFLGRATAAADRWAGLNRDERARLETKAFNYWKFRRD